MTMNKYIGSRYVPLYIGVHDKTRTYEPLSIVSNEAKTETYTSKQAVPEGIELDNETYWVQSGWSNPDMQIKTATEFVDAGTDSNLSIKSTTNGYQLTLSDSNAFYCAGSMNTAQTLNTMLDSGRYIIKPSICTEVPSDIETSDSPAQLVIAEYDTGGTMQILTAYNDDSAMMFVRTYDGTKWTDWKKTSGGGGGGSYTLPVASATKLGGVKIGDSLSITSDGVLDVNSGTSVPIATADTVGLVKTGKGGLTVNDYGVLYINTVKPDNLSMGAAKISLNITEPGTGNYGLFLPYGKGLANTGDYGAIELKNASADEIGGIIVGDGLNVDEAGVLSVAGSSSAWTSGTGTSPLGSVTYKQCGKNVHVEFTFSSAYSAPSSTIYSIPVNISGIPTPVSEYRTFAGLMYGTSMFKNNNATAILSDSGTYICQYIVIESNETVNYDSGYVFAFDYLAA